MSSNNTRYVDVTNDVTIDALYQHDKWFNDKCYSYHDLGIKDIILRAIYLTAEHRQMKIHFINVR